MWLEVVRDLAIVLLALESVVIGVLLCILLLQVRKLVKLLREEIKPLLDSANETAATVQGTAGFVSANVVQPVIKVRSYAAGISQTLRTLLLLEKKLSGSRNRSQGSSSE